MRYVIWAGSALLVVGAVAVYWGVHQCCCRPAPVAAVPGASATTPNLSTTRPPECPAPDGGENHQDTNSFAAKQQPSHEPERVPEGAYGAPVNNDPPEVIQIQNIDPKLIAAMAKYLTDQHPKLVTEPTPAPETEPSEVVVNILGQTPRVANSAEECEPLRVMPRCLPDGDAAEPYMPYADEPRTSELFTCHRERFVSDCPVHCGTGFTSGVALPVQRMPRTDDATQEMPRTDSCPAGGSVDERLPGRKNPSSSGAARHGVQLDTPMNGAKGDWAFSYFEF
jgi:hypothetical protein